MTAITARLLLHTDRPSANTRSCSTRRGSPSWNIGHYALRGSGRAHQRYLRIRTQRVSDANNWATIPSAHSNRRRASGTQCRRLHPEGPQTHLRSFEEQQQNDFTLAGCGASVPTSAFLSADFIALLNTSTVERTDKAGNTICKGAIFGPATRTLNADPTDTTKKIWHCNVFAGNDS